MKCTSDLDCGGEDLCCNNGCGQICTPPGECYTSLWGGGVKCTSDLDCGGEDLCCNNGCGQICTPPGECYTSLWGGGEVYVGSGLRGRGPVL